MDQAIAAKRLKQYEGSTSFLYLDTAGVVTAGVGHAIFDSVHALTLPWDGAPPSAAIEADYARVAAAQKGCAAGHYASLTTCRLSDGGIDALLLADVAAFEAELTRRLPAWTSYPEPAQQALFDMAYNLGIGGLMKFHRLLAACAAGEWEAAATQCHRSSISEARNQATATLFREAAAAPNARKIYPQPRPKAA